MPIYVYRCASCGRSVEVVHSIHGTGPESCDVCGGAMRKALTTPAIVFKGSGWAKKDARTSTAGAGEGASAKEGGTPAAGSSDGGASDTGAATGGAKEAAAAGSSSTGASGSSEGGSKKPSSGAARPSSAADRSA